MKKKIMLFLVAVVLSAFLMSACVLDRNTDETVVPGADVGLVSGEQAENTGMLHTEESAEKSDAAQEEVDSCQMKLQIGEYVFTANLEENSSAGALKEMLGKGPISINMRDYANMEKVGPLGMSLPRNDEQTTTEPGDLILYQGNSLVIYYAPNSWNFTRLGKIENVMQEELKKVLGKGDVTVTLSLD